MTASIAFAVGCGHDPWDGRVYHGKQVTFRTGPVPGQWERISMDGPLLAFTDKSSDGTVDVYARCGQDADDVPLVALTKHLLIGFTERDFKEEKVVPMDGREALHTVVHAKLDGVLVALSIYVMKKDGCVYDLVYVASPARYDKGVSAFDSFVGGFGTGG